jgi:hypothetical protein
MAGSFGFEQHKYDFSMQIFEHRLDPQLREMPSQKLVVADGFRCKTQTEQATGRHPLHLAQLVRIAQRGNEADHRRDEIKKGKAFDNSKLIRNGALLLGRPKCCARDLASRAEDFSMKSKKLNSGTVLILDTRDEVVSTPTKFAKEHRVAAAHLMAVGANSIQLLRRSPTSPRGRRQLRFRSRSSFRSWSACATGLRLEYKSPQKSAPSQTLSPRTAALTSAGRKQGTDEHRSGGKAVK